jgi:hypothetical protein
MSKEIQRVWIYCACECGEQILDRDDYGRPRRFKHRHSIRMGDISKAESHRNANRKWLKNNPNYTREYRKRNAEHIKIQDKDYRTRNKEKLKDKGQRRITFQNKRLELDFKRRKGICEECGKKVGIDGIKITARHHDEYHDYDPLKDTRELCISCHMTQHKFSLSQTCFSCGSTHISRDGISSHSKQQFQCQSCKKTWSVSGTELIDRFLVKLKQEGEEKGISPYDIVMGHASDIRAVSEIVIKLTGMEECD